jgi:hypothetical protein
MQLVINSSPGTGKGGRWKGGMVEEEGKEEGKEKGLAPRGGEG